MLRSPCKGSKADSAVDPLVALLSTSGLCLAGLASCSQINALSAVYEWTPTVPRELAFPRHTIKPPPAVYCNLLFIRSVAPLHGCHSRLQLSWLHALFNKVYGLR